MNAYCIVCGRQFELPAELPNEPDMTCWLCKQSYNEKKNVENVAGEYGTGTDH